MTELIKKKLKEEIDALEHELIHELPKEIKKAAALGDLSEEADVSAGKISTTSPIGRALLNKKVGETAIFVTPNGKREMEILTLRTIHDDAELSGTGLNRGG